MKGRGARLHKKSSARTQAGRSMSRWSRFYAWSCLQCPPGRRPLPRRLAGLLTLGWIYQPAVAPARGVRIGAALATMLKLPSEWDTTVAAVCVGDGDYPFLAEALARMTRWSVYAIDPRMSRAAMRRPPTRVTVARCAVQDIWIREKRVVLFAEHAHASVAEMAEVVAPGGELLAIVELACCHKHWDLSQAPTHEYVEAQLPGDKPQPVRIWLSPAWKAERREKQHEAQAQLRRITLNRGKSRPRARCAVGSIAGA
jgi:hypothetical protein